MTALLLSESYSSVTDEQIQQTVIVEIELPGPKTRVGKRDRVQPALPCNILKQRQTLRLKQLRTEIQTKRATPP